MAAKEEKPYVVAFGTDERGTGKRVPIKPFLGKFRTKKLAESAQSPIRKREWDRRGGENCPKVEIFYLPSLMS